MNDENFITAYDDQGNEIKLNILFTFDSDEFEKSYVVVYEDQENEEEELELQAFSYVENSTTDGELHAIETDEEWDMVEEVIGAFVDDPDTDY